MPQSEVFVTSGWAPEHASGVDWSAYVGHPLDDDEPPPVCGRIAADADGVREKCLCVLRWDGEGYYCPSCDGEPERAPTHEAEARAYALEQHDEGEDVR